MEVRANNDKCPPFTCPPSLPVQSSVTRPEALQHLQFIPQLCDSPVLWSQHSFLNFYFLFLAISLFCFLIRYSPLFLSVVLLICCCLLICLCGDRRYCPWWIPMIQRFREEGARQSPLSCGWAIRLCQTSPIHATWARQWTRARRGDEEEKWPR